MQFTHGDLWILLLVVLVVYQQRCLMRTRDYLIIANERLETLIKREQSRGKIP